MDLAWHGTKVLLSLWTLSSYVCDGFADVSKNKKRSPLPDHANSRNAPLWPIYSGRHHARLSGRRGRPLNRGTFTALARVRGLVSLSCPPSPQFVVVTAISLGSQPPYALFRLPRY
jgi:hypothetical protein